MTVIGLDDQEDDDARHMIKRSVMSTMSERRRVGRVFQNLSASP